MSLGSEAGRAALKGAFFDYGHTLVRSDPVATVLGRVLSSVGYDFAPEQVEAAAGSIRAHWKDNYSGLPRGERWTEPVRRGCNRAALARLGLSAERADELSAEITARWRSCQNLGLFGDTLPVLRSLRREGLAMGVVSQNFNSSEKLRDDMRGLGIDEFFDVVVTSEESGYDKPDPRLYLHASERIGLSPAELCHIGNDYDRDVAGARGAGILPILVEREPAAGPRDCITVRSLSEARAEVVGRLLRTVGSPPA